MDPTAPLLDLQQYNGQEETDSLLLSLSEDLEDCIVSTMDSLPSCATEFSTNNGVTTTTCTKRVGDELSFPIVTKKTKFGAETYRLSQEARQLLMNEPIENEYDAVVASGCDLGPDEPPTLRQFLEPNDVFDDEGVEPRVGTDSWQMNVLYRMLHKLAPQPQTLFRSIIARAIERHNHGEVKYDHLPGSIFEEVMMNMDPALFLETYIAVRKEMNQLKNVSALVKRPEEITDMQLAMGYAFALGRKHAQSPLKGNSLEIILKETNDRIAGLLPGQRDKVWEQIVELANEPLKD